jgi:hypothetical protein
MKKYIETRPNPYGFGHDWTLVVDYKDYGTNKQKRFFLGQDVKFCKRVLGRDPKDVVKVIGSNDLSRPSSRRKLANFIYKELSIDYKEVRRLQPWEIAAE